MQEFINGSLASFEELAQRSRNHCITFQNQTLPLGFMPKRGRIAFEAAQSAASISVQNESGIRLMIDYGYQYTGNNAQMQQWVRDGYLDFDSPSHLHTWFTTVVSQLFADTNPATSTRLPTNNEPARTDMSEVQRHLSERNQQNRSALITPDALAGILNTSVKGQATAIQAISERVSAHVNRVQPRKPASLFFVGPTGTGKTRTASKMTEALKELNCNDVRYLRLDMNEYQESHRISQLLGSPQGYAGYGEGAQLVKQLSAHPQSVVLFDEIEKAHPNILLALMNAMDAGRLSSPTAINGSYEIDCRKALFIFTSNLDAQGILEAIDGMNEPNQSAIDNLCRQRLTTQGLRPELAARIGTYAVFKPLGEGHRLEVVMSAIQDVASEYGIKVHNVAPEIVADIVSDGDGQFGVRADEYRIDSLLGLCLAKASHDGLDEIDLIELPPRAIAHEAMQQPGVFSASTADQAKVLED